MPPQQRKKDSVRLSASQIAAMTGFHPYSNLAKVLMDSVHHEVRKKLLNHDAKSNSFRKIKLSIK